MQLNGFVRLCSIIFSVAVAATAFAQPSQIIIDDQFQDWQTRDPIYTDATGDQQSGSIDFGRLWAAHDQQFLFIRIEIGAELNLQNDNQITLYLDTDNNASTGDPVAGIGAELVWTFGQRSGFFVRGGIRRAIRHGDISLVTGPTVSGSDFEFALDRAAKPDGVNPLFTGETIAIAFADKGAGQDRVPNAGDVVRYSLDSNVPAPWQHLSLQRKSTSHVRMLAYNVLDDGYMDSRRRPAFSRIFAALDPDIIGMQEMRNTNAASAKYWISQFIGDSNLYSEKIEPDIIVVSRYPIVQKLPIDGNGAFLIDLSGKDLGQVLLIVAHLPCCNNDAGREDEIDAILAFIRDAKAPGGELDLPENTPIVIMGDLNLVGRSRQLRSLLTGDILNEPQYGPDFDPDWDGTPFADLRAWHLDSPMTFTWYSPSSSYNPGRLDFIIYSDSVLDLGNAFVLFTPEMPADSLAKYGLKSRDVPTASDHTPVVADVFKRTSTGIVRGATSGATPETFALRQNYPNPFNAGTRIDFELAQAGQARLAIYSRTGEQVRLLLARDLAPGSYRVQWDGQSDAGTPVASGLYMATLQVGDKRQQVKMLLLR